MKILLCPLSPVSRLLSSVSRALSPVVSAINEAAAATSRQIAAFNEAISPTEEWVRIAPFGEWPNKVGLQVFDREAAEAMVKAFNSISSKAATLFRGMPIYVGHPDNLEWHKENPGIRAEAVGRLKQLDVRADGLYGRAALNDEGKRLLSGDAAPYEAHSPHWGLWPITHKGRKAFRPLELYSIGLTNNPNIPGTQIGLNEVDDAVAQKPMKEILIKILASLGKPAPANATDEQLLAAANEALPAATTAVAAVNELTTLRLQLVAANNSVQSLTSQLTSANSLVKAANEARTELVLTSAVNEGRITQAQRAEWAGKFGAAGADFAAIEAELGKLKKAVNTQNRVATLGQRKGEANVSADTIRAINEAVETKKKAGLDHWGACAAVQREKPELFANAAE